MASRKCPTYEYVIPKEVHPRYPGTRRIRYLPARACDAPRPGGFIRCYANMPRYPESEADAALATPYLGPDCAVLDKAVLGYGASLTRHSVLCGGTRVRGAVAVDDNSTLYNVHAEHAESVRIRDTAIAGAPLYLAGAIRMVDVSLQGGGDLSGYAALRNCTIEGRIVSNKRIEICGFAVRASALLFGCDTTLIGVRGALGGPSTTRPVRINMTNDVYLLTMPGWPNTIAAMADGTIYLGRGAQLKWDRFRKLAPYPHMCKWLSGWSDRSVIGQRMREWPAMDWPGLWLQLRQELSAYYKAIGWKSPGTVSLQPLTLTESQATQIETALSEGTARLNIPAELLTK